MLINVQKKTPFNKVCPTPLFFPSNLENRYTLPWAKYLGGYLRLVLKKTSFFYHEGFLEKGVVWKGALAFKVFSKKLFLAEVMAYFFSHFLLKKRPISAKKKKCFLLFFHYFVFGRIIQLALIY